MKKYKSILIIISLGFIMLTTSCQSGKKIVVQDFGEYFEAIDSQGCIIIYDQNKKIYSIYNEDLAESGILPASTFKIYNSLIALESGVASDKDYQIEWDRTEYEFKSWNKNQTLESAMKSSVVWYYQEIARRIGFERMQEYLDKLNYGNQNIDSGVDIFWLEGNMKISAMEQIELIKKLYSLDLPFSKRSQNIVKELLALDENENYKLSGKTGTVMRLDNVYYSWFVGYIETNSNVYFISTNLEKNKSDFPGKYGEAKTVMLQILKELKIVE